jgi:hypothetical protein
MTLVMEESAAAIHRHDFGSLGRHFGLHGRYFSAVSLATNFIWWNPSKILNLACCWSSLYGRSSYPQESTQEGE